MLIALSINKQTHIYDLKTGLPLGWSVPYTGNYHFAPDNTLLAVNCPSFKQDQKPCLKIYKVSNGDELFSFEVDSAHCSLLFDTKSKSLYVGSDMMLRAYSLTTGVEFFAQCLADDCRERGYSPFITSLLPYKEQLLINFTSLPSLMMPIPRQGK